MTKSFIKKYFKDQWKTSKYFKYVFVGLMIMSCGLFSVAIYAFVSGSTSFRNFTVINNDASIYNNYKNKYLTSKVSDIKKSDIKKSDIAITTNNLDALMNVSTLSLIDANQNNQNTVLIKSIFDDLKDMYGDANMNLEVFNAGVKKYLNYSQDRKDGIHKKIKELGNEPYSLENYDVYSFVSAVDFGVYASTNNLAIGFVSFYFLFFILIGTMGYIFKTRPAYSKKTVDSSQAESLVDKS